MRGLRVFAPATVANVACGYDILGFALENPGDEIVVKETNDFKGLRITQIHGDPSKKLPYDIKLNTAGVAAQKLLEEVGYDGPGIEMRIYKKMRFGTGLGSSAASAVAGVYAVNELLKRPFQKRDLLKFAIAGEQAADGAIHGDNVAPCLLGGMVLVRDAVQAEAHRVYVPAGLHAVVIYPHVKVLTKESRAILNEQVSLQNHIVQSANLAAMIIGFSKGDLDLVGRSMKDIVIEPQRASLIPHFYQVQEQAFDSGALGCSISGAGPSIFAMFSNSLEAEKASVKMGKIYKEVGIEHDVFVSRINNEGVKTI